MSRSHGAYRPNNIRLVPYRRINGIQKNHEPFCQSISLVRAGNILPKNSATLQDESCAIHVAANINANAVDEFGEKLLNVVNHAGLAMMLSIGHRTGLFDTMAELPPASSEQIATTANLNERYVRECLGALVTGGIVHYDASNHAYSLPPEHVALLTRKSDANFASTMQWISVLGEVENRIVQCFREGGGVEYSEYSRFHEVMSEESYSTVVSGLEEHIIPLCEDLRERLESGIDVLDVGCGPRSCLALPGKTIPK